MDRLSQKPAVNKVHATHQNCLHQWNADRFLQNQSNPIIKKNRLYYQKCLNRQNTQRSQSFFQNINKSDIKATKHKEDPQQVSFSANKNQHQYFKKQSKTVKIKTQNDHSKHKEIQDLIKIHNQQNKSGNRKSYPNPYYVQNLKNDIYKRLQRNKSNENVVIKPILSSKPYFKKDSKHQQIYRSVNFPNSSRTVSYQNNQILSSVPGFSNPLTPLKSAKSSIKFQDYDSITNKSFASIRKVKSPSNSDKMIHISLSKAELKGILKNHQDQLIDFISGLLLKQ